MPLKLVFSAEITLIFQILSQKKLVNAKLVAMRPFDFNLFIDNSRKVILEFLFVINDLIV